MIWSSPATSFRCAPGPAACCSAPATPRRRWIWRTLAGCRPIGVLCEIMNDDGTMARLPQLRKFAKKHRLKICTIADLIEYRRTREKLVERVEVVKMPTDYGDFDLHLVPLQAGRPASPGAGARRRGRAERTFSCASTANA